MRFNRNMQYAMLLALYLCRSGRAKLSDIAAELALSLSLAQVIANKMKTKGVLISAKGPGGGYELNGDPTVLQVLVSVSPMRLLKPEELTSYIKNSSIEARIFVDYVGTIGGSILPLLQKPVRDVAMDLLESDAKHFNRINNDTTVN